MDRTLQAIKKQLNAFNCDFYEVGIKDANSGQMMIRTYNEIELIGAMGWLKSENAKGAHIYIRPFNNTNMVLIDDVDLITLTTIEEDGYKPFIVIETSPQNYQAWLRITDKNLKPSTLTFIAKYLARFYDSDPNSADYRHFGRLAGFTNNKPCYVNEMGQYPFVLLKRANKSVTKKGEELVKLALKVSDSKDKNNKKKRRSNESSHGETCEGLFIRYQDHLSQLYGSEIDHSRADWMSVCWLIAKGYEADEIKTVLYENSNNISVRKVGHIQDYVERTVDKAWDLFISNDESTA